MKIKKMIGCLICLTGTWNVILAQSVSYSDALTNGNDPVWGGEYYRYFDGGDDAVTTEAELLSAIHAATGYDANKPCIIPVANNIMLTGAIIIPTNTNIVLRKVILSEQQPENDDYYMAEDGNYIIQKWWDFKKPWTDIRAATADLYDGEPDWFITIDGDYRHFNVAGSCCLTTENITLKGRNEDVTYFYKSDETRDTARAGGGVYLGSINATVALACNIAHTCNDYGGAIGTLHDGEFDVNLYITGGVISHSRGIYAGGVHYGYTETDYPKILEVSGYTIVEDVFSNREGGGFYIMGKKLTVNMVDNVIIRRNTSGDGGGIHTRRGVFLNLCDNVLIQNNRTLALAKESELYPGNGGGICLADYAGDGTQGCAIYDHVVIECNLAARGGGGISAGNSTKLFTPGPITLYGGVIRNNIALGSVRELSNGWQPADKYAIGGGGAIYAYDPKQIIIPYNSTIYFDGNLAESETFINCNNLRSKTTGFTFLDDDDYYSHIQADVHTSLVNGPQGTGYSNLYNNRDIGMPNKFTSVSCPIFTSIVPLILFFLFLLYIVRLSGKKFKKRTDNCAIAD